MAKYDYFGELFYGDVGHNVFAFLDLPDMSGTFAASRGMRHQAKQRVRELLTATKVLSVTWSEYFVNFKNKHIGNAGIKTFSHAVTSGALPRLVRIFLSHNRIGDVGLTSFSQACRTSRTLRYLKHLDLCHNQIFDEGMKSFASSIASGAFPDLQVLLLDSNGIGDAGLIALSDALKPSSAPPWRGALRYLHEISVSHNQIGNEGMKAFASLISSKALRPLIKLNMAGNYIGDEGVKSFVSSISGGSLWSLVELDLSSNVFGSVGIIAFEEARRPPTKALMSLEIARGCGINL